MYNRKLMRLVFKYRGLLEAFKKRWRRTPRGNWLFGQYSFIYLKRGLWRIRIGRFYYEKRFKSANEAIEYLFREIQRAEYRGGLTK